MIDLVARMHGCSYDEVMGQASRRYIVEARHAAYAAVKTKRPDYSLPMIGRIFDRHHTSILYGLKRRGFQ
jgi:chromosomal replication initiation ATPase DnaA